MTRILIVFMPLILIGCQGFEAYQHPDSYINGGRGISGLEQLGAFVTSQGNNPQFRKAKVTTHSTSLKVKSAPDSNSPTPLGAPSRINKGEEVYVYWPKTVTNNHIKILIKNITAWVTYKSLNGLAYVTLLEDTAIPTYTSSNASILNNHSFSGFSNPFPSNSNPQTSSSTFLGIDKILLSQSALNEAHLSVSAVQLTPAKIPTCSFNPLVGNTASAPNCYQEIVLSSAFRNFISQHAYQCAQQASRSTFGQSSNKIIFHSSGAGQVRRNRKVSGTSKKSTHSIGQAIDLFAVSLFLPSGPQRRIPFHRDHTDGSSTQEKQNHQFYWSYVNCWRQRIKSHAPCNCSTTKNGAITYQDDNSHYNHVHMSLPFCKRSQYHVSCV